MFITTVPVEVIVPLIACALNAAVPPTDAKILLLTIPSPNNKNVIPAFIINTFTPTDPFIVTPLDKYIFIFTVGVILIPLYTPGKT